MDDTKRDERLYGYHGRYLHIDLTKKHARFVPLSEDVLRRFIGGSGLGAWLLLVHDAAMVNPLDPAAVIAFTFSPLVGSPVTTSAKFAVVSKSPLTERINDSLASSGFALSGKRSGCDAIVITGRAATPSIVLIENGQVKIEPADALWGQDIQATEHLLRATYGRDAHCAVIGPAGEQCVRYATISHDGRHAGRGGSGAVLGSKNIKAVVARGSQRCDWADTTGLMALAKDMSRRSFGPATAKYRELGTATNLLVFNRLHALPTRNFQSGSFTHAEQLAPETLNSNRTKTRASCAACTIGCEHIYALEEKSSDGKPPDGEERGVRVEYENLFALGSLCGIGDAELVLRASQRCDQLGLDTISLGGTVAFAMECVERGLLDAPWLVFGDGSALLRCIDEIAARRGIGRRLAAGSRRLAEQIGGDAHTFAPHVKGLEIPGYEPRALQTMALGFAVGTRGADHNRSSAYEVDFSAHGDRRCVSPDTVALAIEAEDRAAVMDSLILCKFLRGVFNDFFVEAAEMLRRVTGWDVTGAELRQTGKRIIETKKVFNVQAGWTPSEDTLPERFFTHALPDDPAARLSREQLAAAIAAYNIGRGWDAEGWPSQRKMAGNDTDRDY